MVPQFTSSTATIITETLQRRIAAVTIAVGLFSHDHGRFPATLQELVPDYLPAVPMDPRNEDRTPLGYVLAEDGRRPVLYSAGDTASPGTPPPGPASMFGGNPQESKAASDTNVPEHGVLWQDLARPSREVSEHAR
jgi:hypothetical protein